ARAADGGELHAVCRRARSRHRDLASTGEPLAPARDGARATPTGDPLNETRPLGPPRDCLRVEGIELECIVGIRPAERKRPQRVRLDVTLGLDLARAGRSGRIAHTVDYSMVLEEVTNLLYFREYRLIEMATEEIAAMLFGAHPLLDTVAVRLEKPEALGGKARAGVIEIERPRASYPVATVTLEHARIERYLETQEAVLEVITVPAHGPLAPLDRRGRSIQWLTAGVVI